MGFLFQSIGNEMTQIRTQSVSIKKGKVIIARILAGTDLISGIEKICQDNQIAYGTIVAAIGNLSRAKLVYAVVDKDAKFGINFSEPTSVEGPLELLSCQGMIGQSVKGELSVHLHGLLSDQDMKVYGGHFFER